MENKINIIYEKNIDENKNYFISPINNKKYYFHYLNRKKIKCEKSDGIDNCIFCDEGLPLLKYLIFDIVEFDENGTLDFKVLVIEEYKAKKILKNLQLESLFLTKKLFSQEIIDNVKRNFNLKGTKELLLKLKSKERGLKELAIFYDDI